MITWYQTYDLPKATGEVLVRSAVNMWCLNHTESVAKRILQRGRRHGDVLRAEDYWVALKPVYIFQLNTWLCTGAWVHLPTITVGADLVGLYAFIHMVPYDAAVNALGDAMNSDPDAGRNAARYQEERNPLHSQPVWDLPVPHHPSIQVSCYRNGSGNPFALVLRYSLVTGHIVKSYRLLVKHRESPICHWAEVLPKPPYPLYGELWLRLHSDWPVVVVDDEELADDLGGRWRGTVFTTVMGGLDNLLDADLGALAGHCAHFVLRPDDLPKGLLIRERLLEAGVVSPHFSVGLNEPVISFDQIEKVAQTRGITLIASPRDQEDCSPYIAVTSSALLEMEFPVRDYVISPILPQQGLAMIHAVRGIGKTHVALGIAYAVATGGSYLKWKAPKARRVLFLDGEMPAWLMQQRLRELNAAHDVHQAGDFLRVFNPDLQGIPMPDISTTEGQQALEPFLEGVELLIVDNLSTLCRSSCESGADSWGPVQSWLLELRRRGMSVLVVHHSGKSGKQRGSSRHEDVLDTVLCLHRPGDYNPSQGARFEVHIEKGRSVFGADAEPFEARLEVHDGQAVWLTSPVKSAQLEHARGLFGEGKSVRTVAEELGVSKSTAGRLRQQVAEEPLSDDEEVEE